MSDIITYEEEHLSFDFDLMLGKAAKDPKKRVKVIKEIEKIVRKSLEYRTYIKFLKHELNLSKSVFFKKIDISDKKKFKSTKIEIHHHPFTLWNISDIMLTNFMRVNSVTYVNVFDVANEVLKEHYLMTIGVVPLTKTEHQLAHDGALFISKENTSGNVVQFGEKYITDMNDDQKSIYYAFVDGKEIDYEEKNAKLFDIKVKYISMDESGSSFPLLEGELNDVD